MLYEMDSGLDHPAPNTDISNIVIELMVKYDPCKESAMKCERILSKMSELSKKHRKSHQHQHQHQHGFQFSAVDDEESYRATQTMTPNARTYNRVMNAWAQARHKISGECAEEFLMKLRIICNDGSNGDATNCHVQPNNKSYNIAIHSWAKSDSKSAAMHAERILKLMEEDFQLERFADVEPDNISYTSVLTAWANSARKGQQRAVEKAESILQRMEYLHREGLSELIKPDTISFNAVLNVYAKSQDRDARERCEALFEKMKDMYRNGNKAVSFPPLPLLDASLVSFASKTVFCLIQF